MGFSPDLVFMGLLGPNYGVTTAKAILAKRPLRHGCRADGAGMPSPGIFTSGKIQHGNLTKSVQLSRRIPEQKAKIPVLPWLVEPGSSPKSGHPRCRLVRQAQQAAVGRYLVILFQASSPAIL
jgi:hypothetical protein